MRYTYQFLPIKLRKMVQQKDELEEKIKDFDDGYEYVVVMNEYGRHRRKRCSNIHTALENAMEYNGDNGYAHIVTNNRLLGQITLPAGNIFYIEDVSNLVDMKSLEINKLECISEGIE